jgi:hypothetical protein
MQQLTYISTAKAGLSEADVAAILAVSRRNNRRDGITGLLIHDGRRFLQALEGPAPLVDAAFTRIRSDPRHRATVMLSCRDITAREFGEWAMAAQAVAPVPDRTSLAETVSALVADVSDRDTQALFASFARIDRVA